jgi:hypothetical protein
LKEKGKLHGKMKYQNRTRQTGQEMQKKQWKQMALEKAALEEQVSREKTHNNMKRGNCAKSAFPCVLLRFTI